MMLRDDVVRINLRVQDQRVNYISVFPTHPRLVQRISRALFLEGPVDRSSARWPALGDESSGATLRPARQKRSVAGPLPFTHCPVYGQFS